MWELSLSDNCQKVLIFIVQITMFDLKIERELWIWRHTYFVNKHIWPELTRRKEYNIIVIDIVWYSPSFCYWYCVVLSIILYNWYCVILSIILLLVLCGTLHHFVIGIVRNSPSFCIIVISIILLLVLWGTLHHFV